MGLVSDTINRPGIDAQERRLRIFHLVVVAVTLPVLLVAMAVAIVAHDWLRAAVEMAVFFGMLGSSVWLARSDDGRWIYRFNIIAYGGLLATLCVLPSMQGSGFAWAFLFPPVAFFARGPREGLFWTFTLLTVLLAIAVLPLGLPQVDALHESFKVRMLASYLALTLITFGYEVVRSRLYRQVLSERQQLEAEQVKLNEARLTAEEATAAKSRFLANMSHEIRTPLHGALGMLHLLDQRSFDETQRETVETARRSAASLLHIIDDVLDVSKIEAGRLALDDDDLDLSLVVHDVADLFRGRAEQAGLTFDVSIADDVPLHLRGDPGRIRQVLANLVANALKFTLEGGVEVRVALDEQVGREATIRFSVVDTGIGIDPALGEAVFEPFTQADGSATRRFGGSGLGLAISGELARLMGGEIGFESIPGDGSTFWFTLVAPVIVPPAAQERDEVPVHEEGEAKGRVLVAEDNVVSQRVATRMLEKLGCHVEVAADGAEALEALEGSTFDLVLMDCQMPRLDGYEATARIKASEGTRHIPVIALTAHAMKGDRDRCLAAGMDDYLSKPFSPADLKRILDQWCRCTPNEQAS